MSKIVRVGMADLQVCKAPDGLTTLGLGSCIGIAMRDPVSKIGGLAHIMLPDSTAIKNNTCVAKFADTGIEELVNQMVKAGANRNRLEAKIAGGAQMFNFQNNTSLVQVGLRNAQASLDKLKELKIKVLAQDTGKNYGRTVTYFPETGEYQIKAVGKETTSI